MRKETKTAVYDEELGLEAYRFKGIAQPFPNHFHEYYVIGFVEEGERRLSCRNREYMIRRGDVVLFNPGDSHACVQVDGGALDYKGDYAGSDGGSDRQAESSGIFRNRAPRRGDLLLSAPSPRACHGGLPRIWKGRKSSPCAVFAPGAMRTAL